MKNTSSNVMTVSIPQEPNLAGFIRAANAAPLLSLEQEQALATQFHANNDLHAAKELVLSPLR